MIIIRNEQTPVVEQKPKRKRFHIPKHLLVALIFFLVVGSLLGGTFLLQSEQSETISRRIRAPFRDSPSKTAEVVNTPTPTEKPDPTKDWKTYANKSFSVQYPGRFTIKEEPLPISQLYPKIYATAVFTDQVSTITIVAAKSIQNFTLNTVLGNGPYIRYTPSTISGKSTKTIKIDSVDGSMVENIPAGKNGTTADVIAIANGKIYQLTVEPASVDVTTFNLMLSTVKILNQEPSDETDSWKLHIDSAYKFNFRYPLTYALEFNKAASGSPSLTGVYNSAQPAAPKFKVEVQDSKNFGLSAITSRELLKLSLEDYVNKKWEYNKSATDAAIPNKKVTAIKETTLDGKPAYQFSVTGKYVDDNVTELLSEEYLFIFTEHNGYKFKIWFPKANTIYNQILNTLMFTK